MRAALILIALAIMMPGAARAAGRPVPPKPARWVTDSAALLSESTKSALDARLEAYEHQTGHQVIVWIEPTLGDQSLEEWTQRVFTAWGIGRRGNDDGVALFVFPTDRAMRIEVGYGLEAKLPDLYAARIMDEAMRPELAAGHGDAAVTIGVNQILARIGPDAEAAKVTPLAPRTSGGVGWFWIVLGILAVIGLVIVCATHPNVAWFLFDIIQSLGSSGGFSGGGGTSGGGGGGGFSGGGGRSGGGGASSSW